MCCIPQNSGRINVMHSQWINIGWYNWAGFGLVFVTDWAEKNNNLATLVSHCLILTILIRAANSIKFYSSSSYFSKSEFNFAFSNLIFTSSSLSSTKISF